MNMILKIKRFFNVVLVIYISMITASNLAFSADIHEITINIKNHEFIPKELHVPTGHKIKLKVKNQDKTVEEFESHDLKREKIVAGEGEIIVSFGPLDKGEYKFFGEFHEDTAQGKIIATEGIATEGTVTEATATEGKI